MILYEPYSYSVIVSTAAWFQACAISFLWTTLLKLVTECNKTIRTFILRRTRKEV